MYNALIFNFGTHSASSRSVGAYIIAKHLRDQNWDIEVIEFAKEWNLEQLKQLTRSRINKNTKFLGFSYLYTYISKRTAEYCKWVKETYPDIVLISGGATNLISDNVVFDYHIQGYSEYALTDLLSYLFSNGPPIKFSMINSGAKKTIPANEFYPAFPKRSLKAGYQDRDYILENEWLTIEFSRGCKFSCDFCNFPILGVKGDHTRDAIDFYEEVSENYDKFGVKNYNVSDETFNDRIEKISKYADVVEKLNFVPFFSGFVRADLMISNPQQQEELLRMNFLGHHYGLESFNKQSVKVVGKGMDPERIKKGVLDIKNYYQNNGRKLYRGSISLVLGLPYETTETLDQSVQWLVENWNGENIVAFTLMIGEHELINPSKMTLNYKKYGYEKMTEEEISITDQAFAVDQGFTLAKGAVLENTYSDHLEHWRKYLYWKNKDMNIRDAVKYSHIFHNAAPYVRGCWQIGSLDSVASVEERIKPNDDTFKWVTYTDRVVQYIRKKLN